MSIIVTDPDGVVVAHSELDTDPITLAMSRAMGHVKHLPTAAQYPGHIQIGHMLTVTQNEDGDNVYASAERTGPTPREKIATRRADIRRWAVKSAQVSAIYDSLVSNYGPLLGIWTEVVRSTTRAIAVDTNLTDERAYNQLLNVMNVDRYSFFEANGRALNISDTWRNNLGIIKNGSAHFHIGFDPGGTPNYTAVRSNHVKFPATNALRVEAGIMATKLIANGLDE